MNEVYILGAVIVAWLLYQAVNAFKRVTIIMATRFDESDDL